MSTDWTSIEVPEEELEAPTGFEPIPTGAYRTTLQTGSELRSNDRGWVALRTPFLGFVPSKGDGKAFPTLTLNAQFTIENPKSAQAVQIGQQGVLGMAQALGLTTSEGGVVRPTWTTNEELVEMVNAMAGTEVEVYIKTAPRKAKPDGSHLKNDGTPWIDSEIKRVSAVKEG